MHGRVYARGCMPPDGLIVMSIFVFTQNWQKNNCKNEILGINSINKIIKKSYINYVLYVIVDLFMFNIFLEIKKSTNLPPPFKTFAYGITIQYLVIILTYN